MFDYHSMDELAAQNAGWDAGYAGEPATSTTDMVGYWAGVRAYHDDHGIACIVPSPHTVDTRA